MASADIAGRPVGSRLESIDFLRGLAMIFMALDHTRNYFTNVPFQPENLELTSLALFLTRWLTHFCAPLFFFLAGAGAFFYGQRRTPAELRRFLWTRGLWLIVLEFTVVGTGWTFLFPWGFFGVIWALGASMVLLSQAVRLPAKWVGVLSVAIIVLHDTLDKLKPADFGALGWLWNLLHFRGGFQIGSVGQFVLFPLVPWVAVMGAGFAFGALLQSPERRSTVLRLGTAMTVAFVVLRLTNLYGNPPAGVASSSPGDWGVQATFAKSVILFLDTEKYPPSLQFLLMTLGPSLMLVGGLEDRRITGLWRRALVFGRVPLFFYVLHLYLIHALAVLVALAFGQPVGWLLKGAFMVQGLPNGYGHDLPVIWAVWALVIVLLYFPCRWFAALKERRHSTWLSYL